VTAGGGGDGNRLFESFIEAWPKLAHRAHAIIVTGPLLEEGLHRSLVERAVPLPRLRLIRFATNMMSQPRRLLAGWLRHPEGSGR